MQLIKTVKRWSYWPIVEPILKVVILLLLLWSIYQQLFANSNIEELLNYYQSLTSRKTITLVVIVLILMPVNWLLEAFKWQNIIKVAEPITLSKALKAVLSGVTLSLLTPNRIGEYGGRIAYLNNPTGINQLVRTFLCVLAQLTITFIFGIIGLAVVSPFISEFSQKQYQLIWILSVSSCLIILLVFFNINAVKRLPSVFHSISPKTANYLHHLKLVSHKDLAKVITIGSMRYAVYSMQYALLIVAFGIDIPFFTALAMVAVLFLLQTLIPTIAAFEIAIRGNLALFLLSPYVENNLAIISAVITLWTINLMVPALTGYIIILKHRFSRKN